MLPNTINSPTAADLNRKTILDMAIYVYEVALALTGNIDYADNFLREYLTRAETAVSRVESDADTISAKVEDAITAAENASSSERNAQTAANNAEQYASSAAASAEAIAPYVSTFVAQMRGIQERTQTVRAPADRGLVIIPIYEGTFGRDIIAIGEAITIPATAVIGHYTAPLRGGFLKIRVTDPVNNLSELTLEAVGDFTSEDGWEVVNVNALIYGGGGFV